MQPTTTELFNLSLAGFAAAVHAAVRSLGTAPHERFGDRKVFVAAIASALGLGELDALWFHRRLLDAHREGHLLLARADLVAAMDPKIVAASEISLEGCAWHFVIDRAAEAVRRLLSRV